MWDREQEKEKGRMSIKGGKRLSCVGRADNNLLILTCHRLTVCWIRTHPTITGTGGLYFFTTNDHSQAMSIVVKLIYYTCTHPHTHTYVSIYLYYL